METTDKAINNLKLENVEGIEPKVKNKSLVKFIHVFESDVEKKPAIRQSKKKKLKHNLNWNHRRLKKNWQVSDSYNYLHSSKSSFGTRNL